MAVPTYLRTDMALAEMALAMTRNLGFKDHFEKIHSQSARRTLINDFLHKRGLRAVLEDTERISQALVAYWELPPSTAPRKGAKDFTGLQLKPLVFGTKKESEVPKKAVNYDEYTAYSFVTDEKGARAFADFMQAKFLAGSVYHNIGTGFCASVHVPQDLQPEFQVFLKGHKSSFLTVRHVSTAPDLQQVPKKPKADEAYGLTVHKSQGSSCIVNLDYADLERRAATYFASTPSTAGRELYADAWKEQAQPGKLSFEELKVSLQTRKMPLELSQADIDEIKRRERHYSPRFVLDRAAVFPKPTSEDRHMEAYLARTFQKLEPFQMQFAADLETKYAGALPWCLEQYQSESRLQRRKEAEYSLRKAFFPGNSANISQPTESESNMSITITTQVLINGNKAENYDDASLYELIRREEVKIEELGKIKNKPQRLVDEISERQDGINALVTFMNNRPAKTTTTPTTGLAAAAKTATFPVKSAD